MSCQLYGDYIDVMSVIWPLHRCHVSYSTGLFGNKSSLCAYCAYPPFINTRNSPIGITGFRTASPSCREHTMSERTLEMCVIEPNKPMKKGAFSAFRAKYALHEQNMIHPPGNGMITSKIVTTIAVVAIDSTPRVRDNTIGPGMRKRTSLGAYDGRSSSSCRAGWIPTTTMRPMAGTIVSDSHGVQDDGRAAAVAFWERGGRASRSPTTSSCNEFYCKNSICFRTD